MNYYPTNSLPAGWLQQPQYSAVPQSHFNPYPPQPEAPPPSSYPWNHSYSSANPYANKPSFYASTTALNPPIASIEASVLKPKRACVDWKTFALLVFIWAFLTISCLVLLFFSREKVTTGTHIARVLAASSIPLYIGEIRNLEL
jgi:hypothetical protein